MQQPDICIAGAGIIGLSLALELHRRGARVTVVEQGVPLSEASTAAAGMLAAADPDNPPQLRPFADLSLSLYPEFLDRIGQLSGTEVPCQTHTTLQRDSIKPLRFRDVLGPATLEQLLPGNTLGDRGFYLLDEQSVDPRQLANALLSAVQATSIRLLTGTAVLATQVSGRTIAVSTSAGTTRAETIHAVTTHAETIYAGSFVDCTGAWAVSGRFPVVPVKGQLLAVAIPPSLPLTFTLRTEAVYIVPRTLGPHAGRAVIGATIEDAGFDKTVRPTDIARLHALAADLLPQLSSAPILESWAGLRPATPDKLPLLGPVPGRPNHFLATGHYRNGILLTPATAHVMAQIVAGETPSIDVTPFSPARSFLPGG